MGNRNEVNLEAKNRKTRACRHWNQRGKTIEGRPHGEPGPMGADYRTARRPRDTANPCAVVAVLVSHDKKVDLLDGRAAIKEPLAEFANAQPTVHQNSGRHRSALAGLGLQQQGIALATAAKAGETEAD